MALSVKNRLYTTFFFVADSKSWRPSNSHYWVKSYCSFPEWVDFAYWWSFIGGRSTINGATSSSLKKCTWNFCLIAILSVLFWVNILSVKKWNTSSAIFKTLLWHFFGALFICSGLYSEATLYHCKEHNYIYKYSTPCTISLKFLKWPDTAAPPTWLLMFGSLQ